MDKEIALHNIAMCASKAFIDINKFKYSNLENDYSLFVSDLTDKYIEAYSIAEKNFSK